jgi:flavodoxin
VAGKPWSWTRASQSDAKRDKAKPNLANQSKSSKSEGVSKFMKITLVSLVVATALAAALLFFSTSQASAADGSKILIAYFSQTNSTQKVAEAIQKATGGTLFRIETKATYPSDYKTLTDIGKKEKEDNIRPELKANVDNIAQYDVVFIGYPIWWGSPPMAVLTFLDSNDLSGKKIVPFCTSGSSGITSSLDDIKKLEPNATILEGLALSGSAVQNDPENSVTKPVADFLAKLKL